MTKDKLGFFGIIKEAMKIYTKSPSFIILTFLTSLPLFCFLLLHEIVCQQTYLELVKVLSSSGLLWQPRTFIMELIREVSLKFLLQGLLYWGIGHLLDLLNTIIIVQSASMIYARGETVMLRKMLCRPFQKVGFKGPLITSIYSLILASLTWIGLVSWATYFFMPATIFMALFGLSFIALLIKYVEWSSIWNMGLVISILEEKHGDVALGVSAYISRGSRKRGLLLMLLVFVLRHVLRLLCLYGIREKRSGVLVGVTIGQVFLVCFGNVIKWVVFTVYYYDCKKRFLEKKVDVEQGRAAETLK